MLGYILVLLLLYRRICRNFFIRSLFIDFTHVLVEYFTQIDNFILSEFVSQDNHLLNFDHLLTFLSLWWSRQVRRRNIRREVRRIGSTSLIIFLVILNVCVSVRQMKDGNWDIIFTHSNSSFFLTSPWSLNDSKITSNPQKLNYSSSENVEELLKLAILVSYFLHILLRSLPTTFEAAWSLSSYFLVSLAIRSTSYPDD